ncbi:hypothetical protein OG215_36030 (plasmid) [Streptomyces globisporus]|uniref:hypothetical protein n=1 Tax=Streptomyces globisporus TaxID=1908 RepID=UPI002F919367|nr:hypothetical protein OG215_36030 [Streptomyces globisporus]
MSPLQPGDLDPYEHLLNAELHPVTDSPWLGRSVRGQHGRRSIVQRVYATPFGVDVALCLYPIHRAAVYDTLRLEVTDMLSTPNAPAARRTAYLRNYRELLRLHGRAADDPTVRVRRAIQRRQAFYEQFLNATVYVEAALLEGVQAGDQVVDSLGVQMTVNNPDAKRDRFKNWRTEMTVTLAPQHARLANHWRPAGTEITWPIRHEGWGLLPTLGLL